MEYWSYSMPHWAPYTGTGTVCADIWPPLHDSWGLILRGSCFLLPFSMPLLCSLHFINFDLNFFICQKFHFPLSLQHIKDHSFWHSCIICKLVYYRTCEVFTKSCIGSVIHELWDNHSSFFTNIFYVKSFLVSELIHYVHEVSCVLSSNPHENNFKLLQKKGLSFYKIIQLTKTLVKSKKSECLSYCWGFKWHRPIICCGSQRGKYIYNV